MHFLVNLYEKIMNKFIKNKNYETEILTGIDLEHLDNPDSVKELRNKIVELYYEKREIKPVYEKVIHQLTLVQKIDVFPKQEIEAFEKLARLHSETLIQKENFQNILRNQNDEPMYLEHYKEEIPKTIENMKEHEQKQRIVKRDLDYLEGEKGSLHYNESRYKKAVSIIRIILIASVFIAAIASLILSTMYFIYAWDIFIPSLVVIVILIFLGMWLYIFRRYLVHELKKNQMLQKRAIELENKTKIKYVRNQQFLDYEYKKYRVNSSEMLQLRWDNYKKNQENKDRFRSISNNISALITDLELLLERNAIEDYDYVFENVDYFVSKRARHLLKKSLETKRTLAIKDINRIDKQIDVLFKILQRVDDSIQVEDIINFNEE